MENKIENDSFTRRGFLAMAGLAASAAAGVAPAAAQEHVGHVAAAAFAFGSEPPRMRKSFYDLSDSEVRQLCAAIGYLRNGIRGGKGDQIVTVDSPIQWDQYARAHAHHCVNQLGFDPVHWSWYFLPWHRGYLFFLERLMAHVLQKIYLVADTTSFALPYWDWTNHPEMPNTKDREARGLASPFFGYALDQENMATGTDTLLLNGVPFDNLALWDGNRTPSLEKPQMLPANEKDPASKEHISATRFYMSAENLEAMLLTPFETFAGKSTVSPQTGQGLLEAEPHNYGHDWVGSRYGSNRDMGTLRYAAHDPVFFLHHANVDRIWSLYQNPQPDLDGPWGVKRFPFLDIDGQMAEVSVADIVKKMATVTYAPPSGSTILIAAPADRLPAAPAPLAETILSNPVNLQGKPVTVSEAVKPSVRTMLAADATAAKAKAVWLEITTGPVKFTGKFTIRVFAGKPDADAKTSLEDPHFLGQIRALDVAGSGEAVQNVFAMTLRGGEEKLKQSISSDQPLKLTFVPVGLEGPTGELEVTKVVVKIIR